MSRALSVLAPAFIAFLATYPFFAVPAYPQNAGVGVGIGVGSANSSSNATSFGGGQGGQGGQGGTANAASGATGGQNALTINNNGQATDASGVVRTRTDGTLDTRVSGGTVSRQTGGLRNVPAVFAPGLAAAGLETCLGSVSGGGSFMGGGFSFGTTVPDPGCAARLDSRTLWSMGLKKAAVARLCLQDNIQRSMPEVCAEYLPQPAGGPGVYAPAPAVQAARLEPAPYNGGAVEVVERRTGRTRVCAQYDPARGRCLAWGR
jgi:hypothetical protein